MASSEHSSVASSEAASHGPAPSGREPSWHPYREPRPAAARSSFTLDRIIRFVLRASTIGLAIWLIWYFSSLVIYLAVGGLLAYLMRPLVDRFLGLGLGRILSILLAFVLVFGALSVGVTSLFPFVAQQIQDLSQQVSVEFIAEMVDDVEARVGRFLPIQQGAIRDAVTNVFTTLFTGDQGVADLIDAMLETVTNIVYAILVIPFVTFFFLKDGLRIRHGLLKLVPNRYFEMTLGIIEKVESTLGRYFWALLLQCVSIAALASVLLAVVGLDYALVVGVFAGLANTIPYFGPLMGFLAGTLVGIAQTGDLSMVPGVLLAMGLTQVADNVLFQPFIFSRAARSHPLIILFAVIIGAQLASIIGMLLAIPLLTVVRVIVQEVLWSLRNYRILRSA